MVGAAVLIVDDQNRLLLMKRSDCGCWGLPGGTTGPGASLEDVRSAGHDVVERDDAWNNK